MPLDSIKSKKIFIRGLYLSSEASGHGKLNGFDKSNPCEKAEEPLSRHIIQPKYRLYFLQPSFLLQTFSSFVVTMHGHGDFLSTCIFQQDF